MSDPVVTVEPGALTVAALEYFGTAESTGAVRDFLVEHYRSRGYANGDELVERLVEATQKQINGMSNEHKQKIAVLFGGDPLRVLARQAGCVHGGRAQTLARLSEATMRSGGAGDFILRMEARTRPEEKVPVVRLCAPYLSTESSTSAIQTDNGTCPTVAITASGRAVRNALGAPVFALPRPGCLALVRHAGHTLAGMAFPGTTDAPISFESDAEALATAADVLRAALFFSARGVTMAHSMNLASTRVLYMHPSGPRLSPTVCAIPSLYAALSEPPPPVLPMCAETGAVFTTNALVAVYALLQIEEALKEAPKSMALLVISPRRMSIQALILRGQQRKDLESASRADPNKTMGYAVNMLLADELSTLVRVSDELAARTSN